MRIATNIVPGLFLWPIRFLKKIIRPFGVAEEALAVLPPEEPEKSLATVPAEEPESRAEEPDFSTCCMVLSDTDNDVKSVNNTLRFAGLLDEHGEFTDNLQGITIFNTGDLIDKKNPDFSVVEYWQHLQKEASAKGGQVKLIVGNHEQEIWQKIREGEKYSMKTKQVRRLTGFIESLDLFHVADSVLFIHGYPTLEFLQTLLHYREVTGKDLNSFNADHYKKSFISADALRQYSYVSESRKRNYLLYDVANAGLYYKKQGREVAAILAKLKIDIVIHGHRPQRSGVQVDYEFGKWIPGVRMIGNDTMVRRKGLGATVIRKTSSGDLDIAFINRKTESNELRKKVQGDLGETVVSSCAYRFIVPEATGLGAARG